MGWSGLASRVLFLDLADEDLHQRTLQLPKRPRGATIGIESTQGKRKHGVRQTTTLHERLVCHSIAQRAEARR